MSDVDNGINLGEFAEVLGQSFEIEFPEWHITRRQQWVSGTVIEYIKLTNGGQAVN